MSNLAPALVNGLFPLTPPWVRWPVGSIWTRPFDLDPIWTPYLHLPGLYIMCWQLPDGRWFPEYVGETESFQRRLFEDLALHHFWKSVTAWRTTHICTLHVPYG
jgi:hypothetical protein